MTWQERRIVTFLSAVLAILFAVVLVLAGSRYKANRDDDGSTADSPAVPTGDPGAYTALTYDNGSFSLSFALSEDGSWIWKDDPSFPLDDTTLLGITGLLSAWKPQQTVTDESVLADAGFDQPNGTLTAVSAEGETTLVFGRATTDGASYYVRLNGDETTAYILDGTIYQLMNRPIYEMMELPQLPALTEDMMTAVEIQGSGEADEINLTALHEGSETTWRFHGANITDSPLVRSLMEDLTHLSITKCVDYHPSDKAASICGFDAPDACVTIRYTAENGADQVLSLTVGSRLPDQTGRYVRLGEDSTIYFLPTELLDPLMSIAANGLEA